MSMINRLQKIAQSIQILRLPAIALGLVCLIWTVVILLASDGRDDDRFLIPNFVGALWAMTAHAFIVTFRSVPDKANDTMMFFTKLKHYFLRTWYWLISVAFLATTVAAIMVTNSMISIWLRDYGG